MGGASKRTEDKGQDWKERVTFKGVEGDDSVAEAAGRVGHGDRPVAHGVELVEAAGLEARGHEEDVGASCDSMAHGHIEPHPAARRVGVAALQPPHP